MTMKNDIFLYIFVILLYQACKVGSQVILFDTGSCTHLRLLNITEITLERDSVKRSLESTATLGKTVTVHSREKGR